MIPAMSLPVPKAGCRNCVTFGELRIVTGSEQVQTQNIWLGMVRIAARFGCVHTYNTQKPKKDQNLSLLSSKRSSFPVFRILNNRNPLRRAPHIIMNTDTTILRASPLFSLRPSVRMERTTKLVPPAKSVS